jgi:hypothetical protein
MLVLKSIVEKTQMERLILVLLFTLVPLAASAAESPRSVFIHAACDGKISSAVLSSLREGIRTSQKYQLVRTLDDEGRMDIVLTIYMNCAERSDVAAVAIGNGLAKCFGTTNCHLSVDGSSIRSALCDASAAVECGRALFKAFDEFMKRPNPAQLKLN